MQAEQLLNRFVDEVKSSTISLADFEAVILIGSHAYREFARSNSDIDIIAIYKSGNKDLTTYSGITKTSGKNLLELRVMSMEEFQRYVLTCELPKLFAFIRGYELIWGRDTKKINAAIQLGISRYKTDCLKLAGILKNQVFATELLSARLHLTDSFNYISDERIVENKLLLVLRRGEIIKDFITYLWKLKLIKAVKLELSVDVHSNLIYEIGLFRVFCESRGSRITDYEKYKVDWDLESIFRKLGQAVDCQNLRNTMEEAFEGMFDVPMTIHENENIKISWPWI